jgi:hypothetical protein
LHFLITIKIDCPLHVNVLIFYILMSITIAGKEYPLTSTQIGLSYQLQLTNLPDSIGQLVKLTKLDISNNNFVKLPDSIGQLTNLTSLKITRNSLLINLPDSIGQLINLTELRIDHNSLTKIPESIGQLTNLTKLEIWANRLTQLPNSIEKLVNLNQLCMGNNKLTQLPDSIRQLTNLTELHIWENQLTELPDFIGQLTNLTSLTVQNNKLTQLPNWIGQLTNLTQLYIWENQLTELPIQLINLIQCDGIDYHGNPIEYIPPPLRRFLNRHKNVGTGVYNDTQNVHDHNIQESIKNSIFNIINDKLEITTNDINQQIVEDDILKTTVKQQLQEYITDVQIHRNYQVNFQELLNCVWQRIITHKDSLEIKKILNTEMQDSLCKCFTGRLSRLVNCLNGFYDDIQIKIHDNQQIGNIILLIKHKLETEEGIDVEEWKSEVKKELIEREYKPDEIEEWLEFID